MNTRTTYQYQTMPSENYEVTARLKCMNNEHQPKYELRRINVALWECPNLLNS